MRRLKSTVSWSVDDEVIPNIIHVFHGSSPIHIKNQKQDPVINVLNPF